MKKIQGQSMRTNSNKKIKNLQKLKKGLMENLLTGKLRVKSQA